MHSLSKKPPRDRGLQKDLRQNDGKGQPGRDRVSTSSTSDINAGKGRVHGKMEEDIKQDLRQTHHVIKIKSQNAFLLSLPLGRSVASTQSELHRDVWRNGNKLVMEATPRFVYVFL